jgi:hypothetical protein
VALTLTLTRAGRAPVVCSYAAANGPQGTRNAGFQGCSDGSVAGQAVEESTFALAFTAAGSVALTDPTCGTNRFTATAFVGADTLPVLDEPISAADTTALRQGFSWPATQPVTELDAQGRPLLYYGLVYIENQAQVGFLDQMEIHHDFLPILEGLERWHGQVGIFTHHGDGQGVFTFVLMTGQQYNQIRQAAVGGAPIFSVIAFRTPPPGFANSDGRTVSYDALSRIRFRYRGIDPVAAAAAPPTAPILCVVDLGGGIKNAVQNVANFAHGTANFVAHLIGLGAGVVTGTNDLSVIVTTLNTDPTFNPFLPGGPHNGMEPTTDYRPIVLRQAWGQDAGFPLPLTGAKVRARGIHIPSFSEATLDGASRANGLTFNVGVDTSVCLLLENDAAQVIDFITAAEICDISDYSAPPGNIGVVLNPQVMSDFTNVLAQLTDTRKFSSTVTGLFPAQVQTLVGHYADLLPVPQGFTPCFTLPNLATLGTQPIDTLLSILRGLVSPQDTLELLTVGSCVYDVDMMIASIRGVGRSRGSTTHEYGHWMMCNLLNASGPLDLTAAYTPAILETLAKPVETVGECDAACGAEGFADVIADQVAGGTAYGKFPNQGDDISGILDGVSTPIIFYCDSGSTNCFENNIGGPGEDLSNIDRFSQSDAVRFTNKTRFTSVVHDFLDSTLFLEPEDFPSNGNFWHTTGGPPFLLDSFVHQGARDDEPIQMPGTVLRDAILERRGISIDQDAILGALADRARAAGYNWCEVCQLFALHDHGLSSESATAAERFNVCQTSPTISKWLGPPPSGTDTNCKPLPITCPAGQIVSTDGTCITPPCSGGQVLNFNGQCAAACDPVVFQSVRVDEVRNGVCVTVVP